MPVNVTKLSEVFCATVQDRLDDNNAKASIELACCPNTVTFKINTVFGGMGFDETKAYQTLEWSEFEGCEDEIAGGIAVNLCELIQRRMDRYASRYTGGSDG